MILNQLINELNINRILTIIILSLFIAMNFRTIYNLWGTPVTDNPKEHKSEILTIIILVIAEVLYFYLIFLSIFYKS